MNMQSAAEKWKSDSTLWSIPDSILSQAETSPWIHPPALFEIPEQIAPTISHQRASEGLPRQGTVLDVGCGGGIGAFGITPQPSHAIGVDHQPEMLKMFTKNGDKRGISTQVFDGFWPEIAKSVPSADVVTAYHVVYNVSELVPFLQELNDHANSRVVIEMPVQHPLSSLNTAWKKFWDLERPTAPTPQDLLNVLDQMGIAAKIDYWSGKMRVDRTLDESAEFTRIRLCLPKERLDEIRAFLEIEPIPTVRELATIWWDK